MSQAEHVIAKFGGIRPMARILKHRNPTTVQGWAERGYIPVRQQAIVLSKARENGIKLRPDDFFTEARAQ
jgi:hypothetical protein